LPDRDVVYIDQDAVIRRFSVCLHCVNPGSLISIIAE
jgi:hypothetical protein